MDNLKGLPQVMDETLPEPEIKTQKYLNLSPLVAEMLAHGCGIVGTAMHFKIAPTSIRRWLETTHFGALVEQKKEEYRLELLENIKKAGKKDHLWQANAWLAERNKMFDGDYHQPSVRNKGPGNIEITINLGNPPTGSDGITIELGQGHEDKDK
jgi:hypothetical protein